MTKYTPFLRDNGSLLPLELKQYSDLEAVLVEGHLKKQGVTQVQWLDEKEIVANVNTIRCGAFSPEQIGDFFGPIYEAHKQVTYGYQGVLPMGHFEKRQAYKDYQMERDYSEFKREKGNV